MVDFIGIQASGKSSFFHENFRDTRVRLSLDMLSTHPREKLLFDACVVAKPLKDSTKTGESLPSSLASSLDCRSKT